MEEDAATIEGKILDLKADLKHAQKRHKDRPDNPKYSADCERYKEELASLRKNVQDAQHPRRPDGQQEQKAQEVYHRSGGTYG